MSQQIIPEDLVQAVQAATSTSTTAAVEVEGCTIDNKEPGEELVQATSTSTTAAVEVEGCTIDNKNPGEELVQDTSTSTTAAVEVEGCTIDNKNPAEELVQDTSTSTTAAVEVEGCTIDNKNPAEELVQAAGAEGNSSCVDSGPQDVLEVHEEVEDEESDVEIVDLDDYSPDQVYDIAREAMNEGQWRFAREALSETVERMKDYILEQKRIGWEGGENAKEGAKEDESRVDFDPSLGKFYLLLGTACLREMSSSDILESEGKPEKGEDAEDLDQLAHWSLELSRAIFKDKMKNLIPALENAEVIVEFAPLAEQVTKEVQDGDGELPAVGLLAAGLIKYRERLGKVGLVSSIPFDLHQFMRASIRVAELSESRGEYQLGRDVLLEALSAAVECGVVWLGIRSLLYDLQHLLQCCGQVRSSLLVVVLMQKVFEDVANLGEIAESGINAGEAEDATRLLEDIRMSRVSLENRTPLEAPKAGASPTRLAAALQNALGDVNAEETGTRVGFDKAVIDGPIADVSVRRKRPRGLESEDTDTKKRSC